MEIRSMVSAVLVSILIGLAASNVGIIPCNAPACRVGVPAATDDSFAAVRSRHETHHPIDRETPPGFPDRFRVATVVGTLVAFLLVPMRLLGQDNWKIASALMGSYISGSVNYMAISGDLGVSPSVMAAEPSPSKSVALELDKGSKLPVLETATAVTCAFAICKAATFITSVFGFWGWNLPTITATVVILSTALPSLFGFLAEPGEAISLILMQVFFALVGASGSIWNAINTAPSIFLFALVQVTVHLEVILRLGRLLRFDLKILLLALNANIGGPTTACGMATAKGWNSLMVQAILTRIFRITLATFLGIAFGLALVTLLLPVEQAEGIHLYKFY